MFSQILCLVRLCTSFPIVLGPTLCFLTQTSFWLVPRPLGHGFNIPGMGSVVSCSSEAAKGKKTTAFFAVTGQKILSSYLEAASLKLKLVTDFSISVTFRDSASTLLFKICISTNSWLCSFN